MHSHDELSDEAALRPKSARLDPEPMVQMIRAATAGRTDILDGPALLGLQRAVGNSGVGAMMDEERSPVLDVVGSGGGSPLPAEVRDEMQGRLGHDFGDVRVHTDSRADQSAKAVQAHAYTVGSDVVFQRDQYNPDSEDGKKMLAHELTHVVQQRKGPVDGTSAPGGITVSDPGDRFEREAAATAESVMAGPAPGLRSGTVQQSALGGSALVQREADDELVEEQGDTEADEREDEQVQGAFVQREAEEDEDSGDFED